MKVPYGTLKIKRSTQYLEFTLVDHYFDHCYIYVFIRHERQQQNRTTKKRERDETDRQTNRQTGKQSTVYISQIRLLCQQIDAHSLEAFPANKAIQCDNVGCA